MAITAAQIIAKVAVEGADQAKSALQGVGSAASSTGSLFKNVLGGALTLAAGAAGVALGFLGDQMGDAVKEAMAHQQVMAQTAQAIKSTGDVSGMSASAIDNLATSLSRTTKFSEDTVQSGENLLLTFTGIGKQVFPDATKAMLDLSQATGQDMKSSAIQLGKALNDPLTGMSALQRVGVTFSASEKEQIKTMMSHNDVIGAQKVMLKELNTEFGGSAQAVGKTLPGALAILGNNFDDLKIKIGTVVIPMLSALVADVSSQVMPALDRFGAWFATTAGPALQRFGSFLTTTVVPAMEQLAARSRSLIPTLMDIGTVVGHVLTVFGQVASVIIANAGPAFSQVGTVLHGVVLPALIQVGNFLIATFKPVWDQLVATFRGQVLPAWQSLVTAIQPILPQLKQFAEAIGVLVVGALILLVSVLGGVAHGLASLLSGVIMIFGGIVSVISGAVKIISGIIALLVDVATGNFGKMGKDLGTIMDGIGTMMHGVWQIIMGVFQAGIGAVVGFVKGFIDTIIGIFSHLSNVLVGHSIVPDMINAIVQWFAGLPGRAGSAIASILGIVGGILSNLWSIAVARVQQIVGSIGSILGTAAGVAGAALSSIPGVVMGVLSTAAGDALSAGANIVNQIAAGIQGAIGAVGAAIGNVTAFISAHLPHSPAKIGPLRDLEYSGAQIAHQIAAGMNAGAPKLQAAIGNLVKPISLSVSPGGSSFAGGMSPYQFPAMQSSTTAIVVQPAPIYLDGRILATGLMPYIANNIRYGSGFTGV